MTGIPRDGSVPRGHIPNKAVREAFLRDGRPASRMAEELGHFRHDSRRRKDGTRRVAGDPVAVYRALGMKPEAMKNMLRRYMRESTALRYAKVLGVDPHEIGL